ncbi:MAG: FkbM family methyltransferase [Verrucomicrobiota bacterium]
MKTIFDIGMFDASDTAYYLDEGFRVVAVEANPALAERACHSLASYIDSGRLQVLNVAISTDNRPVTLSVCGDDLGSSSIYKASVAHRNPIGSYSVPGLTASELFDQHGVPCYLKIDIEGADSVCVMALTKAAKPDYLSFEMGLDSEDLIKHISGIGFSRFKIINQCSFRELSHQNNLCDRIERKAVRLLGFAEPQYIKRKGRLFAIGHSSGPVPWCSDGHWCSQPEVLKKWRRVQASNHGNVWYDLHAA